MFLSPPAAARMSLAFGLLKSVMTLGAKRVAADVFVATGGGEDVIGFWVAMKVFEAGGVFGFFPDVVFGLVTFLAGLRSDKVRRDKRRRDGEREEESQPTDAAHWSHSGGLVVDDVNRKIKWIVNQH